MKRKSFLPLKKAGAQDVSLNITAMADIFTVILVFLLKSYASGAMVITPSAGLELPLSETSSKPVEAVKVELSEKAVLIEGQPVAELENFRFQNKDVDGSGFSPAIYKALSGIQDQKKSGHIIIIADRRTPYDSIKAILASSAAAGRTDFKLAVRGAE